MTGETNRVEPQLQRIPLCAVVTILRLLILVAFCNVIKLCKGNCMICSDI